MAPFRSNWLATTSHPVFSEDRMSFVPAGSLRTGERLRTRTGTTTIEQIRPTPGLHEVFNLEIGIVHEYYVSAADVLVHNTYGNAGGGGKAGGTDGTRAGADNTPRSTLPRDQSGNYLPDPAAEGSAHTTLGTRIGTDGEEYTQGATFDANGQFQGRTDVTDHGRADHTNPHFHPATGPNSVGPAQPIKQ